MIDIRLPESWKSWILTEMIGEGTFGTVYKAERRSGDRVLYSAIKIIEVPQVRSEVKHLMREMVDQNAVRLYYKNMVDDYLKEIQTMDSLKGITNIVSIEDYFVEEKTDSIGWRIYIRMELLESFADYYTRNQVDEEEIIRLGVDICSALEYCADLKIIHRDIKPDNIFRSRHGDYKLGDFGVARQLDRSIGSFSAKGTILYMAPEVYRGEHYGVTADIYSLGLILYKLSNRNRDPFVNTEKQIIYYKEKEAALNRRMDGEALPAPLDASVPLQRVILKATAFQPKDRYSSATEMKKALLAVQSLSEPKPGNRRYLYFVGVGLAVVLLVAGAMARQIRRRNKTLVLPETETERNTTLTVEGESDLRYIHVMGGPEIKLGAGQSRIVHIESNTDAINVSYMHSEVEVRWQDDDNQVLEIEAKDGVWDKSFIYLEDGSGEVTEIITVDHTLPETEEKTGSTEEQASETTPEAELIAAAESEEKARAESESIAAAEAEAKAKAESESIAAAESEAKARAESESIAAAESEAKAKAESESIAAAESEAKAKAESEAKAKAESEAKAKAESESIAAAESEAKARAESEAKAKAESEAKAKAESEAKAKAESESIAAAESEAKARAESEAKAKAESEAKAKAESEAKAKAESEAKAKAESEAKAKAESEAKAKAESEAKAKAESESIAAAESESRAKEEAEAETQISNENMIVGHIMLQAEDSYLHELAFEQLSAPQYLIDTLKEETLPDNDKERTLYEAMEEVENLKVYASYDEAVKGYVCYGVYDEKLYGIDTLRPEIFPFIFEGELKEETHQDQEEKPAYATWDELKKEVEERREKALSEDENLQIIEDYLNGKAETTEMLTTASSLNVRAYPQDGAVKGTVSRWTSLPQIVELPDGWSMVEYNGEIGYVSSNYLVEAGSEEEESERNRIAAEEAAAAAAPQQNYSYGGDTWYPSGGGDNGGGNDNDTSGGYTDVFISSDW